MAYPQPRYRDPIILDPGNYEWRAVTGVPRVCEKSLGSFTECQCAAALIKLERGATYRAGPRSVYLILSGSGIAHATPYRQLTAFHLDAGESIDIIARDETQILRLVLPDLAGGRAGQSGRVEAAD